jgi:hypothetical protein
VRERIRARGVGGVEEAEATLRPAEYGTTHRESGRAPTVGGVALKKSVRRFTAAPEEVDRAKIVALCDSLGLLPISSIEARTRVRVGGEVRSVRVVPRAGAPSLEVTINDGRGSATAVFLGRRKIAGLTPGRKVIVEGMAGTNDRRHVIVNPFYTLLP